MKQAFFLLLCVLISLSLQARLWPAEGAVLNYRLVGFSFDENKKATSYRVEVFALTGPTQQPRPVAQSEVTVNKAILTLPAFGTKYSWRVTYLLKGKKTGSSDLHHFSVTDNPYTTRAKLQLVNKATAYKDLLLFYDNTRTLNDMQGNAVWFLPEIPGGSDSTVGDIRDMKLTPQGTITFLTNKNVHEIDYDGRLLWSGPLDATINGDSIKNYHHEFTKLERGNYVVIGNKMEHIKERPGDTTVKGFITRPCGTIIEYTPSKTIAWWWNSCEHIGKDDNATHFNAFYFDERKNVVYSSYRNINTITKADYPSGEVLATYNGGSKRQFYYQHNCNINNAGELVLFNNNFNSQLPAAERNRSVPTIAVFKEPASTDSVLQKVWEFKTNVDTMTVPMSSGGGSMRELSDGDYLVCTGIPGRNFIVSKEGKILWNLITWKANDTKIPLPGYRISPVTKRDLDRLLFP